MVTLIALFLTLCVPESPKYMYANRRYDETRQILKIIARKNNAEITNDQIEKIVFEFEGLDDILQQSIVNLKESKVDLPIDPT